MMNKMTNLKAVQYVLTNCELPADVAERLNAIAASLSKKASGSGEKKPTATQIANLGLQDKVLAYLRESGAHATCTEILKAIPELEGFGTQKVVPLIRALKDRNLVGAEKGKGGQTRIFAL